MFRLFGRKIRNRLLSFRPIISDKSIVSKLHKNKMNQKLYYDKNVKDLSMLTLGATVRIQQGDKKEWSTKCKVISDANFKEIIFEEVVVYLLTYITSKYSHTDN